MTAPAPADELEVRKTAARMFLWLRANGHTDASTLSEFLKKERRSRRHQRGSMPDLISNAVLSAAAASVVLSRKPLIAALKQAHSVRSGALTLASTLQKADAAMAKGGAQVNEAYSDAGNHILLATERLVRLLEQVQGVDAPAARSRWTDFIGTLTRDLLRAGMPMSDITKLLGRGSNSVAEARRLRLLAARRAGERRGTKKKIVMER